MAVKIRLKRLGKIRAPFYRVVVMDSRAKRDGRAIEEIGKYHPTEEPSLIEIDSERAQYWLGVGAQPSEQVQALLTVTGDWQQFKGLPGAEGTLKVKERRPDKRSLYEAAIAAAGTTLEHKDGATTARRKAPAKVQPAAPEAEASGAEASATGASATGASTAGASAAEPGETTPAPTGTTDEAKA